jgi:hypothetical protein
MYLHAYVQLLCMVQFWTVHGMHDDSKFDRSSRL